MSNGGHLTAERIAKALGGKRSGRNYIARCPAHDDKNPSLSVADGADREILVFCHAGCTQEVVIAALRERGLWPDRRDFAKPSRKRQLVATTSSKTIEADDQRIYALELFEQALPAGGTLVEDYLRSRGITIEVPESLRFHPALKHKPSRKKLPAMIGLIITGTENRPIGVLRTYLSPDGKGKTDAEPAKMMLGTAQGGAIRLAPARTEVMLSEGIETGLSVLQATGEPVWAALSTSGLKAIELPQTIDVVTILVDGDEPGEQAAVQAAQRLKKTVRAVRIARAPSGRDFNDVLIESDEGEQQIRDAVAEAEEILGPLDDLVERAREDPGHAFTPVVVEALAGLQREDRAEFERLRAELKAARVRIGELDRAIHQVSDHALAPAAPAASSVDVVLADCEFFHAPDGSPYVDVRIDGHRETWPVDSRQLRLYLQRRYRETQGDMPPPEQLSALVRECEGAARFDGPERVVSLRVAEHDGCIYIDLGDELWRALEITATGWSVVDEPPVRFRRPPGYRPLPEPTSGGDIDALRPFLNLADETNFILVVAWLVAALRPSGPYPVLVLTGEQGSAKSTFSKLLRRFVDPNTVPLRSAPRIEQDLFIAAMNGHVLAFDNISSLPVWLSDAMCRLATGGGFAARRLYTDTDETLISETRPLILNGISHFVHRPDLADRALFIPLQAIVPEDRKTEAELFADFDRALPSLFGALLDLVSLALRQLPNTQLDELPRMADFARWSEAWAAEVYRPGAFLAAYEANRQGSVDALLDTDQVAIAVMALMDDLTAWRGTATELLEVLNRRTDDATRRARGWPTTPSALSGRLTRAAPVLRASCVTIDRERSGHGRERVMVIERVIAPNNDGPGDSSPDIDDPESVD